MNNYAARRISPDDGKFRMAIANITYDHPRRISEIPTDRPRNQKPDQGQSAHTRIPRPREITPSKTAQPHRGNLRLNPAISRKRPMTVRKDANNRVHASAPATG